MKITTHAVVSVGAVVEITTDKNGLDARVVELQESNPFVIHLAHPSESGGAIPELVDRAAAVAAVVVALRVALAHWEEKMKPVGDAGPLTEPPPETSELN